MLRGWVPIAVDVLQASPSPDVHLMVCWQCKWSHVALSLMSCPLEQNWWSAGCHWSSRPRLRTTWSLESRESLCQEGAALMPLSPCPYGEQTGTGKGGLGALRGFWDWQPGVYSVENSWIHVEEPPQEAQLVLRSPLFWRESTKVQGKRTSQPHGLVDVCNTGWFKKNPTFLWLCIKNSGFVYSLPNAG